MNLAKLGRKATKLGKYILLKAKEKSPELLLILGAAAGIGAVVCAAKAAEKSKEVSEEAHAELDALRADPNATKRDYAKVFLKYGLRMGRVWGPTVACEAVSLGSFGGCYKIMHNRNTSITAAFTALDSAYAAYRREAAKIIGPEKDALLAAGAVDDISEVQIEPDALPEGAKPEKIAARRGALEDPRVIHWNRRSAFYLYNDDPMYMLDFFERVRKMAQIKFQAQGYLMASDICEALGVPCDEEKLCMGWLNDGCGNTSIDLGLEKYFLPMYQTDSDLLKKDVILYLNCDYVFGGGDKNRHPERIFTNE